MPKLEPLPLVKNVKHTMREALVVAGKCFDGLDPETCEHDRVILAARFNQWWDDVAARALCDDGYEVNISDGKTLQSIDPHAGFHDPNSCGCRLCQLIRSN